MSRRRVLVTGLGVVCPIGESVHALMSALRQGISGIGAWACPQTDRPYPAAMVRGEYSSRFRKIDLPFLDRCSQFALVAAGEALDDARLSDLREFGDRAGAFVGTTRGGANIEERWYRQLLIEGKTVADPYTVLAAMTNAPAAQISIKYAVTGPVITHSCACASSGAALGDAYRAIRDNYLDVAIAGGAEAPLTFSMFTAWMGTRALAGGSIEGFDTACRPFDRSRSGLVLGEGAAFAILEAESNFKKRAGGRVYGELAGYGVASDAYHIASPNAEGQYRSMRAALNDSGIDIGDLDYINAHATGTRGGDPIEVQAIKKLLGSHCDRVPVSSTKSMHGHLLGAGSALEFLIATLTVSDSFIPPTINLQNVDPECDGLKHVIAPIANTVVRSAMTHSSGLGGTNVTLVIRAAGDA